MAPTITSRIKKSWNAFKSREDYSPDYLAEGPGYSVRPDRNRFTPINERSIISSIYTRIGIDTAANIFRHIRLDDKRRFSSLIDSGLNNCLMLEANIDQTARAFRQDAVMTMLDKGVIALVPVDTTDDPELTGGFDIQTLRVGEIIQWFPRSVRVRVYNDRTGMKEEITLPKSFVCIIENPMYSVMNEPNSTLQRLTRKLNLLDSVDEQSSSGKLDILIQLPYTIRTETKRKEAEQRRMDIEAQLKGSQYGIAYIDGTERVTQLNRPSENNLLKQVEYLTALLYNQLGLTEAIFDGTADDKALTSYHNRTIEPILTSFTEAMNRTFLTKTARSQKQAIDYFRDPFKYVSLSDIPELGDKLTRNEILTSNEFRQILGYAPVEDPKADELRNKNLPVTPIDSYEQETI